MSSSAPYAEVANARPNIKYSAPALEELERPQGPASAALRRSSANVGFIFPSLAQPRTPASVICAAAQNLCFYGCELLYRLAATASVGRRMTARSAEPLLVRNAAKVVTEPFAEVPVSRCERTQRDLCCGVANLHAASRPWIRSFVHSAASSSVVATAPRDFPAVPSVACLVFFDLAMPGPGSGPGY